MRPFPQMTSPATTSRWRTIVATRDTRSSSESAATAALGLVLTPDAVVVIVEIERSRLGKRLRPLDEHVACHLGRHEPRVVGVLRPAALYENQTCAHGIALLVRPPCRRQLPRRSARSRRCLPKSDRRPNRRTDRRTRTSTVRPTRAGILRCRTMAASGARPGVRAARSRSADGRAWRPQPRRAAQPR